MAPENYLIYERIACCLKVGLIFGHPKIILKLEDAASQVCQQVARLRLVPHGSGTRMNLKDVHVSDFVFMVISFPWVQGPQ